jgi:hypothetical protein
MEPFNSTNMKIEHGVRLERYESKTSGKVIGKLTVAQERKEWNEKVFPASKITAAVSLEELREMRDWIDRLLEEEGKSARSLPTKVGTVVRHDWTDEHGTWSVDYVRMIGDGSMWGSRRDVWRSLARTPNGDYIWKNDENLRAAGTVTVLYLEDNE